MVDIEIYKSDEFGEVRTTTIDDEIWFVGKDVAEALGYGNPRQALKTNVDDEDKGVHSVDTLGGKQNITIVNESGLYSLIFGSKLPTAKRFKHWVTSEVIPSIRKHGGYIMGQESMSNEELLCRSLLFAQSKIEERDAKIAELQPKADYYDNLIDTGDCTGIRETAKIFGIPERQFVKNLQDKGYCFRDAHGKILPYADKQKNGLFAVKEVSYPTGSTVSTKITPKGRAKLFKQMKKEDSSEEQEGQLSPPT